MPRCQLKKTLIVQLKAPLAWLIQNGSTGEARKIGFSWLLVYFNPDLQNGFTLQCLDLHKINETKTGISRAKDARNRSSQLSSKAMHGAWASGTWSGVDRQVLARLHARNRDSS